MSEATLHDGSTISIEVHGTGPALLLPIDPRPVEGPRAEEMRAWGTDPALGRSFIDGLADAFQVIAFGYENHVLENPKPDTLTPANIAADLLAVADAVGAKRFAYYGYSWLALSGLQLAMRTDRLSGLVMGGFPPLGGPYAPMLRVTQVTYDMSGGTAQSTTPSAPARDDTGEYDWDSADVTLTRDQAQQFLTLYEGLRDFDDRAAQAQITCPRLCFAGSADEIAYSERWGGVHVSIGGELARHRTELEALGWEVRLLDGLDHSKAMQAATVLPIIRPWLLTTTG
ncbi:alpha/beta hydrolase [Spongiactinospora sp. TRM90649]|uniref:alpha/beta fold hydrolase n=1 Tax=Spongiactinospora sp. TRM90649 TaxID=3031114 RepID=UPI0023F8BCAC|nr:alpha/beta hydrolase [Spongiactinospora sp. TRM90649]MDF5753932.1 alpha/beta hydrolase [Spongiactinospora sp. TRM90649]